MKLEEILIVSEEELNLLKEVALSHDNMAVTKVDQNSLLSICLRLVDFQCLTIYRSSHGFTEELCTRILTILREHENEILIDCEIPVFVLMGISSFVE